MIEIKITVEEKENNRISISTTFSNMTTMEDAATVVDVLNKSRDSIFESLLRSMPEEVAHLNSLPEPKRAKYMKATKLKF